MGLTTFSPLACGLLTGKYGTYGTIPPGSRFSIERYKFLADRWLLEDKLQKAEALRPLANELGATPAQLALAWCAANPHVSTVLTGATRVEQVYENVRALEFVEQLTPIFLKRIDEALDTRPSLTSSGKL
jgi:aryl-alcohol dehydrogenase-like predicted oxidoreductase